jgi:hypothetical protein
MRLRVPSIVLGVLLLAVSVVGAETAAPLESTKQELRKLGGAQRTNTGPSATDGLRPSLPTIQTPGQDSLPPARPLDPEKLEKEKKRQREDRKNWLVNGVEQLERKDKEKEAGSFASEENERDTHSPSSADGAEPQYLLKLYDERKKNEEAQKEETKPRRSPQVDPLAPFLQGWLGNSPVRGQFFDEFVRQSEGPAVAAGSSGSVPVGTGRDLGLTAVQQAAASANDLPRQPNPYLAELNRSLKPEVSTHALPLQSALNPAVATPTPSKPLAPVVEPSREMRQPERKPVPAPLAEDKKYFPQMKKF